MPDTTKIKFKRKNPAVEVLEPKFTDKQKAFAAALQDPIAAVRELNNRSLHHFLKWAWPILVEDPFEDNWHIRLLCQELEEIAYQVAERRPKDHDLLINVPPGTTKTLLISVIFPVWCWTKWSWMRFITASHSSGLALENAEKSRDIIRSERFKLFYPNMGIQQDKDTKTNFKFVKYEDGDGYRRKRRIIHGGNRYSTTVTARIIGFHADIIIWDDLIDPQRAFSKTELEKAGNFVTQTLSTRKTIKKVSAMIGVMQRLDKNDPTGHWLKHRKKKIRHFSLPGEIKHYTDAVKPAHLTKYYKDYLLDPNRLDWEVLEEMEEELGQYGYKAQVGQKPSKPGGGMFQTDHFITINHALNPVNFLRTIRYWDKAGSADTGAYTAGVKISQLQNKRWLIEDVKRGQWASHERERIIKETTIADGDDVEVWIEQEPGSGGKESAENTVLNLAGFRVEVDKVGATDGNKVRRADPLSVQVNNGNIWLVNGVWVEDFIEEFKDFPESKYKDQVDATSGGFNKLIGKRKVKVY